MLLASIGRVLVPAVSQRAGEVAIWGLVLSAGAGAVLAAVALVGVLLRPQRGDRARTIVTAGLAFVVAHAVTVTALTGDLGGAGLVGLAIVTGVTLGDTRWVAWFTAAAGMAWGGSMLAAAAPAGWVTPALVLVTAAGSTALLEAVRRCALAEQHASRSAWERTSATDPVTGLASREGLAIAGARMVEAARRQGDAVHCLFVEVAAVDGTTDRLEPGDRDVALSAVADALSSGVRGTDVAARWDSEVFCVVGPGVGVSPLELERRVHEQLIRNPPVPTEVWSPHVTAAAATLPPWEDGNLSTLLTLGEQVMQVRRVLRGGRARSRATDRPRPEVSD